MMGEAGLTFLTAGRWASLACLLEVAVPKPGNVHRGADFEDVGLYDFLVSAEILGQTIDELEPVPVAEVIQQAVSRTIQVVETNTNLGLALLLCPLARAIQSEGELSARSLGAVLQQMDREDVQPIYAAIRSAQPGGLGTSPQYDVAGKPPETLSQAMGLARDRDGVARQYTNDFEDVFQTVVPMLVEGFERFGQLPAAAVWAHIGWLADRGDSLIERKCGAKISQQASDRAAEVIPRLVASDEPDWDALAELDFWLRSDGNRRNPGTTADLIAAGLMVGLFNHHLEWRLR